MSENDTHEFHEERIREFSRAYAAALLAGDEVAAELSIREAIDANLSTGQIDDEIIAPALWLVGELWARGEISVADEHIATEISIRVLALQRETRRVMKGRRDSRVMLATAAGEQHVVALRMIGNLLRDAGYEVVMLGPDVPPDALAAAAARVEPDVVCLSSTMPGTADKTLIAIDEIGKVCPSAGFVVGGRGLTAHVRAHPGLDICQRVGDAVQAVDAMIKRAELN
jgi:methanogenic corrinoid protein MtbC1